MPKITKVCLYMYLSKLCRKKQWLYFFPDTVYQRFGDGSFSVAGPVVWNSLPAAVREADSLYSFKRKLKTHFLPSVCFTD